MKRWILFAILLGLGLAAESVSAQGTAAPPLRFVISEVEAGSMASEQYCLLVFSDHRYHYEKANRKTGVDRIRKVYAGELSDTSWTTLDGILETQGFRDLKGPQDVPPLVIEDAHTIAISVARNSSYQSMEFVDKKSRKPYEAQLKPLLSWWKGFRGGHMVQSNAPADPRCALDSTRPIFSQ